MQRRAEGAGSAIEVEGGGSSSRVDVGCRKVDCAGFKRQSASPARRPLAFLGEMRSAYALVERKDHPEIRATLIPCT